MVSRERLYAQFQAVQYAVRNGLEGDIVECGVWRGGASMLTALTLLSLGDTTRRLWLYDTFAGMTEPTAVDVSPWDGAIAHRRWKSKQSNTVNKWCYGSLDEVRHNMTSTLYPMANVNLVQGDVLQTLKQTVPEKIAVLRLDTDWYESTRMELEVLYPRLITRGVLLIDDYGAWQGCKKAVDTYLRDNQISILLQRTDYTGRMAVKI